MGLEARLLCPRAHPNRPLFRTNLGLNLVKSLVLSAPVLPFRTGTRRALVMIEQA